MPALAVILGLFFVYMSMSITTFQAAITTRERADAAIEIERMAAYQSWVAAYAKPRPTTSAAIADTSLGMPTWFVKPAGVGNYISGGKGYVWVSQANQAQAMRLASAAQGRAQGGIKAADGRLQIPGSPVPGPVLPAAIPVGSLVVTR